VCSTKADRERGVTQQQLDFAREYASCNNCAEAYKRTYNVTSTNGKNLSSEGSRILRMPGVATEVARIKQEAINETKLELKFVLDELLRMHFQYREKNNNKCALKTIELLCKYYADPTDIASKDTINNMTRALLVVPPNQLIKISSENNIEENAK